MLQVSKETVYRLIDLVASASAHSAGGGLHAPGEAWLNPQPLPPRTSVESPHPEPWRAAAVARQIITAAALAGTAAENEGAGARLMRTYLHAFVDDFCGTGSGRRVPLPPPWPRSGVKPNALDLLVAAAQFQAVASASHGQPIAEALAQSADRLLEVGLQRFSQ
jgi:hypothetical protein